jgi:hypothetical protein
MGFRRPKATEPEPSATPVVIPTGDGRGDIIWHSSDRPAPPAEPKPKRGRK